MTHPLGQEYRGIDLSDFSPMDAKVEDEMPVLEWVLVDRLAFDTRYQREIEKRGRQNILGIAKEFRWSRFTPLLVAPLGNSFWAVIDGQHRAHAAALRGHSHVPALNVQMDLKEQAAAFSWVNGNVTNVTGFQIFRAALTAREPWAIASRQVVQDAGCRLMTSNKSTSEKKAGEVFCIATVRGYVEGGKGKSITQALHALSQSSYGQDPAHYSANVLGPWFQIIVDHPGLPDAKLREFLDANPLPKILKRVEKLQNHPDYFRTSRRALILASLGVLFRAFLRKEMAV